MPSKGRTLLRVFAALGLLSLSLMIMFKETAKRPKTQERPQLSARPVRGGLGVSLGLFASDPLWDYETFIDELSELGVLSLMIVVPLKQRDHKSDAPYLGVPLSTIERTARQAKSAGMSLTLMPIIQLEERSMNVWRGVLDPADVDAWWVNYRADMRRLAALGAREGVERLVIGAELCSLEAEERRWSELISELRAKFKGQLTYSANWDHYREVPFWELLDEVSMTAYFPLTRLETLEGEWRARLSQMEAFAEQVGRPLLVTEYGYPALESALRTPWDETAKSAFAPKLQAELVTRSTRLLIQRSSTTNAPLRGAFLWNWFGFGGQLDRGYSLRGRLGEVRLRELLRQGAVSP